MVPQRKSTEQRTVSYSLTLDSPVIASCDNSNVPPPQRPERQYVHTAQTNCRNKCTLTVRIGDLDTAWELKTRWRRARVTTHKFMLHQPSPPPGSHGPNLGALQGLGKPQIQPPPQSGGSTLRPHPIRYPLTPTTGRCPLPMAEEERALLADLAQRMPAVPRPPPAAAEEWSAFEVQLYYSSGGSGRAPPEPHRASRALGGGAVGQTCGPRLGARNPSIHLSPEFTHIWVKGAGWQDLEGQDGHHPPPRSSSLVPTWQLAGRPFPPPQDPVHFYKKAKAQWEGKDQASPVFFLPEWPVAFSPPGVGPLPQTQVFGTLSGEAKWMVGGGEGPEKSGPPVSPFLAHKACPPRLLFPRPFRRAPAPIKPKPKARPAANAPPPLPSPNQHHYRQSTGQYV